MSYDLADRTILIFVRSGCPFCTESMPQYRRLAEIAKGNKKLTRLVVVSFEDADTTFRYLGEHGVVVDQIVSTRDVRVPGTPTLLVVDRHGVVVRSWFGVVPFQTQQDIEKLAGG